MIAAETAKATSSISLFVTLLKDPAMLMVLLSLLLVTSTSMITNDYYDAREGVDSPYDSRHPLAAAAAAITTLTHPGSTTDSVIPLSVAKYFTKCLYAILLLSSAFVPSIMARILVLSGAMITYLYTVHLKPITWIKNISCAALVALGPIASGCAAWHVLRSNSVIGSGSAVLSWFCILQSPLSFLVLSLFFGIMGREVLMDIIDYGGDARAGIETIPVRYGKRIAANVALVCSILSSMSACAMPIWMLCSRMLLATRGGGSPLGLNTGGMTPTLNACLQTSEARRLLLSLVGSGMLLRRIYDVWWTNGEDNTLVNRAVDESLLSVLLVLASFL
jgi:4-hydroxybenzoate polyprenyltransferase